MSVTIETTIGGPIATITLRPAAGRTSLDTCGRAQLSLALAEVSEDPRVLVVVLCGEGGDFCEGRDLDEYAARLASDPRVGCRELEVQTAQLVRALAAVPKPVIAAVRGRCMGEGLVLALACDLRVIGDDAQLSGTSHALGERPYSGLHAALSRLVGADRSRELTLSGRTFTAREAVDWGLVSQVAPAARVIDLAVGQAAMLAHLPARQLEGAKFMLVGAASLEVDQALCLASTGS